MKNMSDQSEVLASQATLRAKRQELLRIQSAIATQRHIISECSNDFGIAQMESQRDDLAAAIALGEADATLLSKIEDEISTRRDTSAEAHERARRANSALAGLEKKSSDVAAQLSQMESDHKKQILHYLRSEADAVQRAYIDAARHLIQQYLRVLALNELSRTVDHRANEFAPFAQLEIPVATQLPSGAGIKYVNDGVLFSSMHVGFFNDIPDAVASLRSDLQDKGIDLA